MSQPTYLVTSDEAFERKQHYPIPQKPRLAIDEERRLIERDSEWTEVLA